MNKDLFLIGVYLYNKLTIMKKVIKLKESDIHKMVSKVLKEQNSDFNPPTNKPLGKKISSSEPYMKWSQMFSRSNPDKDFLNKFTGDWFLSPTEEGSNELSIIVNVPERNGHLKFPVRMFVS